MGGLAGILFYLTLTVYSCNRVATLMLLPESSDCDYSRALDRTEQNTKDNPTYCNNGDLAPLTDPKYCQYYCLCLNNQFQPSKCGFNQYYDTTTEMCTSDSSVCSTTSTTPASTTTASTTTPSTTTTSTTTLSTTTLSTTTLSTTTPSTTTTSTTTPSTTTPSTTTTSTTTTSTTTPSTTTLSTTTLSTTTEKQGCKDGTLAPGSDCKHYKKCNKGNWEEESCSWGQYFNSKDKKCETNWLGRYCKA